MNTSVSPKGQVTIPKTIRNEFSIKSGTKMSWEINFEDNVIVLYPKSPQKQSKESLQEKIKRAQRLAKQSNLKAAYLKEKRTEIKLENNKL